METEFPDENDILNFLLYIEPDEGFYKGGRFNFTVAIPSGFPHEPPKITIMVVVVAVLSGTAATVTQGTCAMSGKVIIV
jgi:hypothetical protein